MHQVRLLVNIQPQSVSQAMREKFIPRTIASTGDDGPRGIVRRTRKLACARCVKRGILGCANDFKDIFNFDRWLPKNGSARNVRGVAFQDATAIDQYNISLS